MDAQYQKMYTETVNINTCLLLDAPSIHMDFPIPSQQDSSFSIQKLGNSWNKSKI